MNTFCRSGNRLIRNVVKKCGGRQNNNNNNLRLYKLSYYRLTTTTSRRTSIAFKITSLNRLSLRMKEGKGSYSIITNSKRFATAPMPFRPGYGLGSLIEPKVIQGMEIEAKVRSEIVILEQIENDFESTAKGLKNERDRLALEAKLDNESFDTTPYDEQIKAMMEKRKPIREKRLAAYIELFGTMQSLIDNNMAASTFNSGAASPIKWPECEIKYLDRAYDSISVDAALHVRESNQQSTSDFASGVASSVASSVSTSFGSVGVEAGASASNSIQRNSSSSSDTQDAQAVLVLTAFATHRKVQQFEKVSLDAIKLVKAWNHYHPDDIIDRLKIGQDESIFDKNDPTKQISILSECFLGSAMVGMVHFVRRKETNQSQSSFSTESQAAVNVKFCSWLSSVTGSTQVSTNAASRVSNMMSTDQVDVKFDLTCLGYLPALHPSNLEMAVSKFADFDPANFHKEAANVIGGNLQSVDAQKGMKDNKEATARQSNMSSVIESTIVGITKADNLVKTSVLDLETFMNAFDDYAANAPTTDGVGIPIGMNVLSYGKGDVCFEYAKQYLGVNEDRSSRNPNAADAQPAE